VPLWSLLPCCATARDALVNSKKKDRCVQGICYLISLAVQLRNSDHFINRKKSNRYKMTHWSSSTLAYWRNEAVKCSPLKMMFSCGANHGTITSFTTNPPIDWRGGAPESLLLGEGLISLPARQYSTHQQSATPIHVHLRCYCH
jgi:hypothetical protein